MAFILLFIQTLSTKNYIFVLYSVLPLLALFSTVFIAVWWLHTRTSGSVQTTGTYVSSYGSKLLHKLVLHVFARKEVNPSHLSDLRATAPPSPCECHISNMLLSHEYCMHFMLLYLK